MELAKTKYFSLTLFFFTVFVCSVAEFALIEIKYQVFTGGFLQSHQLSSAIERGLFISLFLTFNLILYGSAFILWRALCRLIGVNGNAATFHFMMICLIVTAVLLVTQFQLHKYFADAMDANLVQSIAGGDLTTAVLYAFDEAFLLILGTLALLAAYFLIYRMARGALLGYQPEANPVFGGNKYIASTVVAMGLLLSAGLVLFSGSRDNLEYNLKRTNSFTIVATLLNVISDVDFDGYGSFVTPYDTAVLDAGVHPGALDIPDNGIDEDGLFGDFTSPAPAVETPVNTQLVDRPLNIVVIVLESARGEIVDKTIDGELVAPNIHQLAHDGMSVREAFSHTGYTATSLASFFSGHINTFDRNSSIFTILKQAGYQVAVFSGQDESWGDLDTKLGTRDIADLFFDAQEGVEERVFPSKRPSSIKVSEETLWRQFSAYSDAVDWDKPQFIYFNMQAGHFPYFHETMTRKFIDEGIPRSEISSENREWLARTYWNAMNYADTYIGKIVAELKKKGIWEKTLLIVSGDHGEELFDNNHLGHGFLLSDVQTRIPVVASKPDFTVAEPMGPAELKDYILSYVFEQVDVEQPSAGDSPKAVFQMIGSLNTPNKIAFRYLDDKRLSLDLRNMLVRPIGSEQWIPFDQAIADADTERELRRLVIYWENLRWRDNSN